MVAELPKTVSALPMASLSPARGSSASKPWASLRSASPPRRFMSASALGLTAWILVCVGLSYVMMAYEFTPGRLGARRITWPTDVSAAFPSRVPGKTTVVAFLHPRCVCSRATLTQLLRAVNAYPQADVIAGVFTPLDAAGQKSWEEGEYVRTIRAALPQAKLVFDRGGHDAQRFGAYTSGTVLVYDAHGREIFRGGITNRRGGEEKNPGIDQLISTLASGSSQQHQATPVYGCPILSAPQSTERTGDLS